MQRTHDQVGGPSVSEDPSGLGVFGIPFEQGLPVSHPRNRKPGVDDYEVNRSLILLLSFQNMYEHFSKKKKNITTGELVDFNGSN
jgi:hypothetical protein